MYDSYEAETRDKKGIIIEVPLIVYVNDEGIITGYKKPNEINKLIGYKISR